MLKIVQSAGTALFLVAVMMAVYGHSQHVAWQRIAAKYNTVTTAAPSEKPPIEKVVARLR